MTKHTNVKVKAMPKRPASLKPAEPEVPPKGGSVANAAKQKLNKE